MRYADFTEEDVVGLGGLGINTLLVEVFHDGTISREVGLDKLGAVVHRFPGTGKFGRHGIMDNAILDLSDQADSVSEAYFENVYKAD